jgi:hypothetical protein
MNEVEVVHHAIAAIHATTGLNFSVVQTETIHKKAGQKGYRADALLQLDIPSGQRRFVAECKSRVDRASMLTQVKSQLDAVRSTDLPLLVTHRMSTTMGDQCRRIGLNFIDTAGNCFLADEDLFVLVKGNKLPDDAPGLPADYRGGTSYGSLRLIFALICKPELLGAPYRELVNASGISLGSVGWIFNDLESRGLVSRRDAKKKRHFLDLRRLQEEWAANYTHRLKPRLKTQRFSAPDSVQAWWQQVKGINNDFLWGGEVGAAALDGHLKPVSATLYTKRGWDKAAIARLVQEHRLRADHEGMIEVVESFWNFDNEQTARGLVPSLLIYADLLALMDPRAAEAAIELKERHLDHA